MPNESIPTGIFRITRPYSDISGTLSAIARSCSVLVAYEHECDDNVSRTHTHVYFTGYEATRATLSRSIKKDFPGMKGNKDLSIKVANMADAPTIICYMSKGKLEPKTYKGIDWLSIDAYKQQWKEMVKPKNLRNKANMLKAMLAWLHEDGKDAVDRNDPDVLYEAVITIAKSKEEPMSMFRIIEYMDSLRWMEDSPRFRDMVLAKYSSRTQ